MVITLSYRTLPAAQGLLVVLVWGGHAHCTWVCRKPERTMYLAFGHDEEVGGDLGAGSMAALLKSRGVSLDMVVDEGGPPRRDAAAPPRPRNPPCLQRPQ